MGTTAVCSAKKLRRVAGPIRGPPRTSLLQPAAGQRDVLQHADADGSGPIGQLVPGQQVPGKIGRQHEDEKAEADDPVQPARGVKTAGEKDAQAVQADHHDQEVGAPEMDVADPLAEQEPFLKADQGLVGLGGNRPVGELQQDAGEQLERHQHGRHAAQAPGQGVAQAPFRDPARPEMQHQRAEQVEPALRLVGSRDHPLTCPERRRRRSSAAVRPGGRSP